MSAPFPALSSLEASVQDIYRDVRQRLPSLAPPEPSENDALDGAEGVAGLDPHACSDDDDDSDDDVQPIFYSERLSLASAQAMYDAEKSGAAKSGKRQSSPLQERNNDTAAGAPPADRDPVGKVAKAHIPVVRAPARAPSPPAPELTSSSAAFAKYIPGHAPQLSVDFDLDELIAAIEADPEAYRRDKDPAPLDPELQAFLDEQDELDAQRLELERWAEAEAKELAAMRSSSTGTGSTSTATSTSTSTSAGAAPPAAAAPADRAPSPVPDPTMPALASLPGGWDAAKVPARRQALLTVWLDSHPSNVVYQVLAWLLSCPQGLPTADTTSEHPLPIAVLNAVLCVRPPGSRGIVLHVVDKRLAQPLRGKGVPLTAQLEQLLEHIRLDTVAQDDAVDDTQLPLSSCVSVREPTASQLKESGELFVLENDVQRTDQVFVMCHALDKPRLTLDHIVRRAYLVGLSVVALRLAYVSDPAPEAEADLSRELLPAARRSPSSRPHLAFVLRGPNAVRRWSAVVGPRDPARARQDRPESLRAHFATSEQDPIVECSTSMLSTHIAIEWWFGPARETAPAKDGVYHALTDLGEQQQSALLVSPQVSPKWYAWMLETCAEHGLLVTRANRMVVGNGALRGPRAAAFSGVPCLALQLAGHDAVHHTATLAAKMYAMLSSSDLSRPSASSRLTFHCAASVAEAEAEVNALFGGKNELPDRYAVAQRLEAAPDAVSQSPDRPQVVLLAVSAGATAPADPRQALITEVLTATVLEAHFELLGLKLVPSLPAHLAKEISPYEVGDPQWRPSLDMVRSSPMYLVVLRQHNAFALLERLLSAKSIRPGLLSGLLVSPTPEQAVRQLCFAFGDRELCDDAMVAAAVAAPTPAAQPGGKGNKRGRSKSVRLPRANIIASLLTGPRLSLTLAVASGAALSRPINVAKILARIRGEGFQILALEFVDTAPDGSEPPDVSFPALAMVLRREDAVNHWLNTIGSSTGSSSGDARSLESLYGSGFRGSESPSKALEEIASWFPALTSDWDQDAAPSDVAVNTHAAVDQIVETDLHREYRRKNTKSMRQCVCVAISPEAVRDGTHTQVLQQAFLEGWKLVGLRLCHLTAAQVRGFWETRQSAPGITSARPDRVALGGDPGCMVAALEKENGILKHGTLWEQFRHSVVASESPAQAARDLPFWFDRLVQSCGRILP